MTDEQKKELRKLAYITNTSDEELETLYLKLKDFELIEKHLLERLELIPTWSADGDEIDSKH